MGEAPLMEHLGQTAALTQSSEPALPGADGMEEHLEDSAVKDLEDVEVKDLVDLNLNLDPEDGERSHDYHYFTEIFWKLLLSSTCLLLSSSPLLSR